MVTSVDTSMSLVSSRHAGQDLNTAATGVTSETLRALADQIVASASPAWLRVSSLATDAWIAGTDDTEKVSAAEKLAGTASGASSARANDTAGASPSAASDDDAKASEAEPSVALDSAVTASMIRSRKLSITSEDMLINAVITFNQTLQALPDLQRQLQGYQADMSSASDDRMLEYLKQRITALTSSIALANTILATFPAAIDDGLEEIKRVRNITGTVYTRAQDGTYTFGQFSIGITLPNGARAVTWSHDGSGVAVQNIQTDVETVSQHVKIA